MDELEEEKRKGREKRTDKFLSFLESTIPGTARRMYVHVQIKRRIARSRRVEVEEGGLHFSLSFLFCSSIVVMGGWKRSDTIGAMIVLMGEWVRKQR